uniref:sulfite exporter TauE/SafE family protein n=2 Tax=Lactiplantibacillus plantarum TaxID=1590 RepID=UPI00374FB46A
MVWLLVFLPGLLAGLVQGLTGFGAAIVMMIFLPQLFPIAQSAAVAGVIMAASVITLVWRYHQHIYFRQITVPFIVYASVAAYSVHLGQVLDVQLLRRLLGALLVSLAGYFSLRTCLKSGQFDMIVQKRMITYELPQQSLTAPI